MENLYKILQVDESASYEIIKASFQEKVKKYHPDKTSSKIATDTFVQIDKAWKILSKPDLRKRYDAEYYEYKMTSHLPVNEELSYDELDIEEINGESFYKRDCRCGGQYLLSVQDSADHRIAVVYCDTCSLSIRIFVSNVIREIPTQESEQTVAWKNNN